MSISLLLMIASYAIVYAIGQGTPLVYVVVPFAVAFWGGVVWLSWLAYSPVMGVVSVLAVLLPPALLLIMLLSYSRASRYIKEQGSRLTFSGVVVPAR